MMELSNTVPLNTPEENSIGFPTKLFVAGQTLQPGVHLITVCATTPLLDLSLYPVSSKFCPKAASLYILIVPSFSNDTIRQSSSLNFR